jgi:trans-aconitate methyltransferase
LGIADWLRNENLDNWLELWGATQGTASAARELMAARFSLFRAFSVLNLCCGPGDVGRAIRWWFPKARVDCVDSRLVHIKSLRGIEHMG